MKLWIIVLIGLIVLAFGVAATALREALEDPPDCTEPDDPDDS